MTADTEFPAAVCAPNYRGVLSKLGRAALVAIYILLGAAAAANVGVGLYLAWVTYGHDAD